MRFKASAVGETTASGLVVGLTSPAPGVAEAGIGYSPDGDLF
jgi:hypothetical protein